MGVVYLARDSELDRFVAIKLLQPTVVGLGESGDMLLQEARTAAKLRHPNILPVFDIGKTESGAHYVVMEYMDGKPLDEVVKNRQFSSSEACEIVMAVTKALDAAHQSGFIHRDIKPANILIDSAGHVKISDFGLAIRQSEQTTDALIGTVPYMAPEQVGKEFGDVGFSTDIWAVGIVFYELLSGRRPFEGNNIDAIVKRIQEEVPPHPTLIQPSITKPVEELCLRCISKNQKDRPRSAKILADELRLVQNQNRSVQLLPVTFAATIVVSVFLIGVLVFCYWVILQSGNGESNKFSIDSQNTVDIPDSGFLIGGIHPSLANNCKIVLNFKSGVAVDIDKAKTFETKELFDGLSLGEQPYIFNQNLIVAVTDSDKVRRIKEQEHPDWYCWEIPVSGKDYSEIGSVAYAGLPPQKEWLRLRFAVSSSGDFQVGTISDLQFEAAHFLVLSQVLNGICNYYDEAGEYGDYLPKSIYESPKNFMTEFNEKQTSLAQILVGVYRRFKEVGSFELDFEIPSTNHEIYQRPFELKNFFDQPISVVDGRLFYQILRDRNDFKGNVSDVKEDVLRAEIEARSPIEFDMLSTPDFARGGNINDPAQNTWEVPSEYNSKMEFARFITSHSFSNLGEPSTSMLYLYTGADKRNATQIKTSGLSRPFDAKNEVQFDGLPIEPHREFDVATVTYEGRSIELRQANISHATAILPNLTFDEIEMSGMFYWSVIRPSYRYVFLGRLPEDSIKVESTVEVYQVDEYDESKHRDRQDSFFRPAKDWHVSVGKSTLPGKKFKKYFTEDNKMPFVKTFESSAVFAESN